MKLVSTRDEAKYLISFKKVFFYKIVFKINLLSKIPLIRCLNYIKHRNTDSTMFANPNIFNIDVSIFTAPTTANTSLEEE